MTTTIRYTVTAPATPGAEPRIVARVDSLRCARDFASGYANRRDLTYQDIRIDSAATGRLVEYAGPSR